MARAAPAVQSPVAAPRRNHVALMPERLRLLSGFLSGELSFHPLLTGAGMAELLQHLDRRVHTRPLKTNAGGDPSRGPLASQHGGQERGSMSCESTGNEPPILLHLAKRRPIAFSGSFKTHRFRCGFEARGVGQGGPADHRCCKSTEQFCCRQAQGDLCGEQEVSLSSRKGDSNHKEGRFSLRNDGKGFQLDTPLNLDQSPCLHHPAASSLIMVLNRSYVPCADGGLGFPTVNVYTPHRGRGAALAPRWVLHVA